VKIACPKCGYEEEETARECSRCGIVFGKWSEENAGRASARPVGLKPDPHDDDDEVADGRIGPAELKTLGIGLVAAIVVNAIPFLRFVFSALITLFHEFGHAVMGWLLGMPAIPAFDLVYGGGITTHAQFQIALALLIAGGFGYLMWLFRQNRTTMLLIGALFLVWLFFVSAEWRRGLAFGIAGHLSEFILAGILFYQALSGVGWRIPELERPLGAFVAFFVQINSMLFAWRLMHDRDFLEWYREGKGGMLMNDLESVALDLHIHTPFNPGIIGVARLLLIFSFVPIAVALIWYFQRARWHRVLRALRTADA
jgi:hypothetical protein